ncbi:unnamed protein product, partial [Mesorhabditis belari]|uniref:Methyltransferase domain-containing protein n=1 Tax=Mesorhabditis belari TaxID=2138241 RepID=A0AAF3EI48_9BILA
MCSQFDNKLLTYLTGGMSTLALGLGKKLGLIEAICAVSSEDHHATPEEVAEKANCKPRYVREWLCCMSCAEMLEVDEEERFWATEEQKKGLLTSGWMPMFEMLPLFSDVREKLEEAVRGDSKKLGLHYEDFSKFYDFMGVITAKMHSEVVVPKLLPDVGNGILEGLEGGGIKCLDVGCGNGFHVQLLAKSFPKSSFLGVDLVEDAVREAQKHKEQDKTENSSYLCCDARQLPVDWANRFDFVTIFDACHDQCRPDLGLKEIYRVLKPGGTFAMIEIKGSGSVTEDKKAGILTSICYGGSLFHCLPVGSNEEGALCLGSMFGTNKALALLKGAGFEDVSFKTPDYMPMNSVFICKK